MKAILHNAFWLMLERVSLSLSGVFVSVYVARYLGPAQFGALNYLLATIAIVVPLVQLGADSVIFNRVARRPDSGVRLMMASMQLRRRLFLLLALPLWLWSFYHHPAPQTWMSTLLLASAYFSVQDVYKIYYDARLQAKRNTLINNLALALAIVLRLALIGAALPLVWFAVPYLIASALPYLTRLWLFRCGSPPAPFNARATRRYGRYLLRVGLPLAAAGLSIVIYTRIDQIMLGNLLGPQAVGWYSAAVTLGQGWIFIPLALVTSLMPGIARCAAGPEREYRIRLLCLLALLISLPALLILGGYATPLVTWLYGEAFRPAADVLAMSTLTALFSVLGTVAYRSMVLLAGYRFIALKMPLVALANVVMNAMLIPRYGLPGAALSTLLAEFFSLFVLNAFFRGGRIVRLQLTCYYALPRFIRTLRRRHA
ncbi:Polysaccharide biosynthesis protein [Serratia rubidaea]|nr:flippase [Serratia rubidaea]SQJ17813.1 Polysaccharide biosynthesis protein [Serratia rubidaea]